MYIYIYLEGYIMLLLNIVNVVTFLENWIVPLTIIV
jgi:hypothetical protein